MTNSRIIEIFSYAKVSIRTTEQIYKRTYSTQALKLSYFIVILEEIIDAFVTWKQLNWYNICQKR